jgi:hypothetical protein
MLWRHSENMEYSRVFILHADGFFVAIHGAVTDMIRCHKIQKTAFYRPTTCKTTDKTIISTTE